MKTPWMNKMWWGVRVSTQKMIWLLLALSVVLSAAFILGWLVQTTLHRREDLLPPPGKMVWVKGEWIHLHCVGPLNAPAIILEAGVMGWSTMWTWTLRQAPATYRVCAWDRPGLGWSAPTKRPPDAVSSAHLLHALLVQEKIKRPFTLVGHSLGGLYSLVYRDLYPKDVKALVLVDPAHPQQLSRLPNFAVRKTFNQVSRLETTLPLLDFGLGRGVLELRSSSSLFKLPPDTRESVIHVSSSRSHLKRSVEEYRAWSISSAAAQKITSVGNIPLTVLSSADREMGDRPSNEAWWELHRSMAGLSARGRWAVIPNTSHQSIIMKEDSARLVLEQILATDASADEDY